LTHPKNERFALPPGNLVVTYRPTDYNQMNNLHIRGLKGLTNVYRPPTQNGDKQPLNDSNYHIREPTHNKPNLFTRVEPAKVYNPIKRHIPAQLGRDYIPASRFMPEIMNVQKKF